MTDSIPPIRRTAHYIGGDWVQGDGRCFADLNPMDDSLVAEIAAGTATEARRAVDAAQAAFPAWARLNPAERQRLFLKAADLIDRRADEIVALMATEGGTGRAFAAFQVRLSSAQMRQAASWGYLPYGDMLRSDVPGRTAMVTRRPLGVVAGFTPWNGAFYLGWRTITLPLAFGNTTVIKPSEEAPITAGLLQAEILEEAGFPPGVCNVVTHAPGEAAAIAEVFFAHPAVRCINFTGSDRTARILGAQAGAALKRTVFELGGYNPMLVLDDADLDQAVSAAAFGAFFHQGQICMNTRKVYVHESLHDAFVERLAAKVRGLKAGDPRAPGVVIGPLINDRAVQQIAERVRDAVDRGAVLVTGGKGAGRVFEPTILTHVPPEAICASGCDETFGPLLVIESFADAEDALARAQATPYGLSASIMTGNQARGLAMAQRLDAGIIHINAATMASEASMPNGGVKASGWGRSGHYAVEDFTEVCLTTMSDGPVHYPI